MQLRHVPGDQRAPVVADDHRLGDAGVVEQPDEVGGEVLGAVARDVGRGGRVAVAALVGREHVEPGVGERLHLVSPRVGALGEPVAQHDERIARPSRFRDVELDAVGDGRLGVDGSRSCDPQCQERRRGAQRVECGPFVVGERRRRGAATASRSAMTSVEHAGPSARRAADRSSSVAARYSRASSAAATPATARRPGPDGNASNAASASTSGPRSERALGDGLVEHRHRGSAGTASRHSSACHAWRRDAAARSGLALACDVVAIHRPNASNSTSSTAIARAASPASSRIPSASHARHAPRT